MLKLLLAAVVPFQPILDQPSPTHGFINTQALVILEQDGQDRQATRLRPYLTDFIAGCDWADTGWKNIGHMYDPLTGTGLKGWPSAPQLLREYWDQALQYYAQFDLQRSHFYLGAAVHLVQDLCVPHHAAKELFKGHKAFEAFARLHRDRYTTSKEGNYTLARTPEGWVTQNATYTQLHFSHCIRRNELSPALLDSAVGDLLPRAQRTTAGFISYFYQTVGVIA
jgi:phospholipase C